MANAILVATVVALGCFALPMLLPWPRWWLGGVLVAAVCLSLVWGQHVYSAYTHIHRHRPIGGDIAEGALEIWTWAFGFGVFARLVLLDLMRLRGTTTIHSFVGYVIAAPVVAAVLTSLAMEVGRVTIRTLVKVIVSLASS